MLARHRAFGLLLLLGGLAACGPIPVDRAEQSCMRDAELASRPRGEVAIGAIGGGGSGTRTAGRIEMEISSDYILGRDPSDVFNRCVLRKSGQMPTRVLADQPGWRG
ncbi:hypothetical protein [Paracoccus saliphilus]|uniref:Lipoprotein n=1 Tax=Paracoccus saliphilus TaxID=405559 RepID=A0AA45W2A4_9RHOB|nr:hypothetical protein [Paracoccus saliphilus]WCR01926.1 hypothetical protein JHX88_13500 [Paracoccus saliphilus]SIS65275.1 hypothetical protein SAMN05421772_102292 [Paracoccus saliphilus]